MKTTRTILACLLIGASCLGVLSTSYEPVSYNANGSVTAFTFPYTFFETSDLVVYYVEEDGTSTTLVEGSGAGKYTVSASNNDYSNGATVTTGTTYADGKIVIERSVPYGQGLSINGDFIPAKPLEQQLDKLAAQTQQVRDEIRRTLTIPVTDDASITTEFPNSETRANKAAYFDADGNATVVSLVSSGTAAGDETTVTVSSNNIISVKDDGIDTDQLADYAVENQQLGTNAVHTINLLDGDVTTPKLDDEAVTFAKVNPVTVATNIVDSSQDVLTTEGAVKGYVDTSVAGVFLAQDFSTDGYQFFESGLVIQWGQFPSSASGTENFPTNFPNTCLQVVGQHDDDADTGVLQFAPQNWNATGFTFLSTSSSSVTNHWMAIGY